MFAVGFCEPRLTFYAINVIMSLLSFHFDLLVNNNLESIYAILARIWACLWNVFGAKFLPKNYCGPKITVV